MNKKYFGKDVKLVPEIKYEWSRIPHFYNAFYVYKYAVGMISALYLVYNVIPTDHKIYINFLKSGSRKSPIDLLYDAGVNLNKEETFNKAFESVKNTIGKWEEILEKKD